ncbi:hypothetical protein [Leisingera aquaemixtae]|uniref:Uncharacterized protein n=1 Tax=Leisingera aquaemixtae TaxID=1396826 RepID=A0ABY5WG99_9RHOB|nr:hypothetical protein [Leisingera aquaemixtae]UWQ23868.1 hypothetical protein K3553_12905 [Leisingera aquaemixtae]UWQ40497.1 hypothetical protein K3718_13155 [Leisingera aquaemixtae]
MAAENQSQTPRIWRNRHIFPRLARKCHGQQAGNENLTEQNHPVTQIIAKK